MDNYEDFLETLRNGELIYFINPYFNQIPAVPHYHLCIHTDGDNCLVVVSGTSSPMSNTRYMEKNNIPFSTFPCIRPDPEFNDLNRDTYFYCNQTFQFNTRDLFDLYEARELRHRGSICESDKLQIKIGIEKSPVLTELEKEEILTSFPDFDEESLSA